MQRHLPVLLVLTACYRSEGYEVRPPAKPLAVGRSHACAIKDGAVRCWGRGTSYATGNSLGPGTPEGMSKDAVSIAANQDGACAIIDDTLRCTYIDGAPLVSQGAKGVAAFHYHNCVIVDDQVQCWGDNAAGELGTGDTTRLDVPGPKVKGLPAGSLTGIATSDDSSCVILDNQVQCWGGPYLGDGSEGFSADPVRADLDGDITALAGGMYDFCAILDAGESLRCWGSNNYNVASSAGFQARPVKRELEGNGRITDVAIGQQHACAVVDGGVQCWGRNARGQVGTPELGSAAPPTWVPGFAAGGDAVAVAAHYDNSCAMRADGSVECWGLGGLGVLGDAFGAEKLYGVQAIGGFGSGSTAVAANIYGDNLASGTTCAVNGGAVYCFGANHERMRGDDHDAPTPEPQLTQILSGATAIEGGGEFFCAIVNGGLRCWGLGWAGRLGTGGDSGSAEPQQALGLLNGVTAVALGMDHGCAIQNGTVLCWGENDEHQVGHDSPTTPQRTPQAVPGFGANALFIASGNYTSCAAFSAAPDDQIMCWGAAGAGQVGANGTLNPSPPVAITGLIGTSPLRVEALSCGDEHCCAIVNGAAQCWGHGTAGELGDGSGLDSTVPVLVEGLVAPTQLDSADRVTCAVDQGVVLCWGQSQNGTLGFGDDVTRLSIPEPVPDLPTGTTVSLSVGGRHACATVDGALYCWGANFVCELGLPCVSSEPLEIEGL